MAQYKTGQLGTPTVNVRNGSNIVTGNGTAFSASVTVTPGLPAPAFKVKGDAASYQVASVDPHSETIYLSTPYQGSDANSVAFQVVTDFTPNFGFGEVSPYDQDWATHLTLLGLRRIDAALATIFVGGGGGNLHTAGLSTTITSLVAGDLATVRVGYLLTANGASRTVTQIIDASNVVVNSAIDWSNGGNGYPWTYSLGNAFTQASDNINANTAAAASSATAASTSQASAAASAATATTQATAASGSALSAQASATNAQASATAAASSAATAQAVVGSGTATTTHPGLAQPDGTSITVSGSGIISTGAVQSFTQVDIKDSTGATTNCQLDGGGGPTYLNAATGNVIIGSAVDNGAAKLQVSGSASFASSITTTGVLAGPPLGTIIGPVNPFSLARYTVTTLRKLFTMPAPSASTYGHVVLTGQVSGWTDTQGKASIEVSFNTRAPIEEFVGRVLGNLGNTDIQVYRETDNSCSIYAVTAVGIDTYSTPWALTLTGTFDGGSGASYVMSSNPEQTTVPTGALIWSLKNNGQMVLDNNGNLLLGATSGSIHVFNKVLGSTFGGIVNFASDSGLTMIVAGGTIITPPPVVTAATLSVGTPSTTGRSINTGGTINASGADYAEYETKNATCGLVAKGQIVGFDAEGLVTDKWADSLSFGVKSTNPNLVGGDIWASEATIGKTPEKPVSEPPTYTGIPDPGPEPTPVTSEWAADKQKYDADQASYATALQLAETAYNTALAQYQAALAAREAALETERQKVDRIAYSGKVPVNVAGANPGDYIVAVVAADGVSIAGQAVPSPTFEQYQKAVGRVRKILVDGRAEISVIVH